MISIGIIGTSWISRQFADAVRSLPDVRIGAVCSRSAEHGEAFARECGITRVHTSVAALAADDAIDTVYIASPNARHCDQAALCIAHDRNVIVEKPAFASPAQFSRIDALLREHPDVRYFEAARIIHTDNFAAVESCVRSLEHVSGAVFSYMKYSSEYDAFRAGATPAVFSTEFAGGALQDLGVYLVYNAVALFGPPREAFYRARILRSGVDGMGTGLLRYEDFDVTLLASKIVNSTMTSEIYGDREHIVIDDGGELTSAQYLDGEGNTVRIGGAAPDNPMLGELRNFAEVLGSPHSEQSRARYARWLALSHQVNDVLWRMHTDAGLVFPADANS